MGLFDYVSCNGPAFVCSEGHDLSGEEFQSKDFDCQMGQVTIEHGRVSTEAVYLGKPSPDSDKVKVYCTCRRCPAFVQFGTGNLVGCDVTFEIELDGDAVKAVVRSSPATSDWLRDEPASDHMKRCEGPMSYADAERLHVHYRELRPEHYAEFRAWAEARSRALKSGQDWPLSLPVGEYPVLEAKEVR